MTLLRNQVRSADGRVIGTRCPGCGTVFTNRPVGTSWKAYADHSWECPEMLALAGILPLPGDIPR